MPGGCQPRYEAVFDHRRAERDAARYGRRGLTWAPRRTVELYRAGLLTGETLLEIGGGIGDLQLEMLQAGVHRGAVVELSGAYEPTASRLLRDAGLTARCERLVADFATRPGLASPADVVVLHSVVCCYPDATPLLDRAAAHARRHLVVSYPRDTWWLRSWAPLQNLYPRLMGSDFRFVVHQPSTLVRAVELAGFRVAHTERNWVDHLVVLTRTA